MANESVASYPSNVVDQVTELFGEHPADVMANIEGGGERLCQLGVLFRAIQQAASGPEATPSAFHQIRRLAQIGSDVADDASNFLDLRAEEYVAHLTGQGRQRA